MRGKTAREIRKVLNYSPKNEREYHTFSLTGWGNVLQYNPETGGVKQVRRRVDKVNIECVSGDRKIYKYMKRKYNEPHLEMSMNKFPEEQEMDKLKREISAAIRSEERLEAKASPKE